jgi:UDP-N-acetylmuramoyl-L-alanine---L-glutamate ligase
MRARELGGKKIVIWGTGREGLAVANFIRSFLPDQPLLFVDEASSEHAFDFVNAAVARGDAIAKALAQADIVIKSPGVSLYHPAIQDLLQRGIPVTSLLNLWFAEPRRAKIICITGTKGKSTTSALLAHCLQKLGKKTALIGNIGEPVSSVSGQDYDYCVIEISSYQAADFNAQCDLALLTSLFPEHLDWHGSLARYYHDKLNLLHHAAARIISADALATMAPFGFNFPDANIANQPAGMHHEGTVVYEGTSKIGTLANNYLARSHNFHNVCLVLAALKHCGLDPASALAVMADFKGLPHRQYELGEKNGVLYVDDSISTTPQSAIAAMETYRTRPITIILGGFDRRIDYTPLADYIVKHKAQTIITIGPSGKRIHQLLEAAGVTCLHEADDMPAAIAIAREKTAPGGVILLSPAAPSYGLFKDFIARGKAFAQASGFKD